MSARSSLLAALAAPDPLPEAVWDMVITEQGVPVATLVAFLGRDDVPARSWTTSTGVGRP